MGLFAIAAAEVVLLGAVVDSRLTSGGWLLAHAGIAFAGVAGFAATLSRKDPSPLVLLSFLALALLGPFGLLGALAAWLVKVVVPAPKEEFLAWYDGLVPLRDEKDSSHLLRLISVRKAVSTGPSTVAPFHDVLTLGSVEQKRALMTLVSDHFRPAFAPVLQRALRDEEPSIRVLAATTAARIEREVLEKTLALEGAPMGRDELVALAHLYATHAQSGLVETARAAELRRKALALYERCGPAERDDPLVATRAAALMLELGDAQGVADRLRPLHAAGRLPKDALPLLLEALFRLRDYPGLRAVCADATRAPSSVSAGAIPDVLRAWTGASRQRLSA